ncbi:hypothetical protein PHSC3_000011 [Chlamydiales bacterium STE3]|nr:hypothetical protein PHSC3_000011 [Chlamydiales bacterium STE3]
MNPMGQIIGTPTSTSAINVEDKINSSRALRGKAQEEENLVGKKELYETAFKELKEVLGSNKIETIRELVGLITDYTSETLYNQVAPVDTSGFERSARILEFSLLLQLSMMGLVKEPEGWQEINSLAEFIEYSQRNDFNNQFGNLNIDSKVLVEKASDYGMVRELGDTLRFLTFSHQNLPEVRISKELQFLLDLDWNKHTEEVLKSAGDMEKLIDYKYNRLGFIHGIYAQIGDLSKAQEIRQLSESYQTLADEIASSFQENDSFLLAKRSQIANMRGLLVLQNVGIFPKNFEALKKAEYFFNEAFNYRSALMQQEAEKKNAHQYFLSNVRTGLITCLMDRDSLTDERLSKVCEHRDALKTHIEELGDRQDCNSYVVYYQRAVDDATKLIESLELAELLSIT